jgi:hypothetical protein
MIMRAEPGSDEQERVMRELTQKERDEALVMILRNQHAALVALKPKPGVASIPTEKSEMQKLAEELEAFLKRIE